MPGSGPQTVGFFLVGTLVLSQWRCTTYSASLWHNEALPCQQYCNNGPRLGQCWADAATTAVQFRLSSGIFAEEQLLGSENPKCLFNSIDDVPIHWYTWWQTCVLVCTQVTPNCTIYNAIHSGNNSLTYTEQRITTAMWREGRRDISLFHVPNGFAYYHEVQDNR